MVCEQRGKADIFLRKKKESENFTFAVGFLFYLTYLVVLNSIKIHFKYCLSVMDLIIVQMKQLKTNHSLLSVYCSFPL